nr:hypothetical protein [Tanacetum cinerariifolium]
MEPRPEPNREATTTLQPRSHVVRRHRERIVGFEEAQNREGSRIGRNAEGIRPSEIEAENRGVNLPPLLAAHLGRNKSDLPTTYKGLMEKTYTWIEAREMATNETHNDRRENFERLRKSYRDDNHGKKDKDRFFPYQGPSHGLLSILSKSPRDILTIEKYPDIQENLLTNDEFEAFTNANDDKMNDLEIKFDQFQKQCEQMQDDLLNQMRNFMQNFQNRPPEVPEQQKQKMEDTMLELVKTCHAKDFLCIHDDVNDLIKSALDSKLLLINSNSQRLDKKEQEVKNVEEQPAGRRNRAEKSLQNFRVIHKIFISLKDTSQISLIHSIAPIQSTKEPEHSLSMGYEHLSITPETESDEVTESNAEILLPIPSKYEVTLEDEIECDMPANDDCSTVFTTFSNPLFKDNDDLDSSDDESLPDEDVPAEEFKIYSNPLCGEDKINSDKLDLHYFNVESDFVESLLNRDTLLILLLNLISLDGNSQQEEIDIVTSSDDVLPPSVENDDDDYDLLLGEADLFLFDNSIPPGIENVVDDPERDVRFLEELLINDSILSHESYDSN